MKTSIELVPVQTTNDSNVTASSGRIGVRNSTVSTDAVTHSRLLCFAADIEATWSISLNSLPPNKVLWLLKSFGNTRLERMTLEALQGFDSSIFLSSPTHIILN